MVLRITEMMTSRLYNDSTVRYSTRINFDVACAMDFHKFPWDRQVCKVKFESFSYSNNQINMRWLNRSMSQVTGEMVVIKYKTKISR